MHYLDNAATTRVSPAAADAARRAMMDDFGNPSSLHTLGRRAADMLEGAQKTISGLVSQKSRVIFTSGGTEADNLALRGAIEAGARSGAHVVTTAIEHHAVLETLKTIERSGRISLTVVKPGRDGVVAAGDIVSAVRDDTILVSMMLINNETGAIQPVKEAFAAIKKNRPKCVTHTDAVQALGKVSIDCGADLTSLSGHKVHGPKGIGALIVSEGVRILPEMTGGAQQYGLRAGTEAMPGIMAFEQAVKDITSGMEAKNLKVKGLSDLARAGLLGMGALVFSGPTGHIMTAALPGAPSEVLMRMLEEDSVYVSAGSACSRGRRSHVLEAMGLEARVMDSAIRISLSDDTVKEDIEAFITSFKKAAERLRLRP